MIKLCILFLVTIVIVTSQDDEEAFLRTLEDLFLKSNISARNEVDSTTEAIVTTVVSNEFNELSCTCVNFYQCNNGTVNTNGEHLIDIRGSISICPSYLETCCKFKVIPDDLSKHPVPPVHSKGCGYLNPGGTGFRITGDENNEADFGEFPWMVAIFKVNSDNSNKYICGGSLIHPQVVMTANHCVLDKKANFKIRAGEWDSQTENEIYDHQDRLIKTVVHHPEYYSGGLFNDIALLILETPVKLAPHVSTICLPTQSQVFDNPKCLASGWGKDVFGSQGKYQVILKKVELSMVDRNQCRDRLKEVRMRKGFELHRSFVCAGGASGQDTCEGDGGSPLVCPILEQPGRFVQTGIVSWGIGCGQKDVPAVYANVAEFRGWIDEQMIVNGFNSDYYKFS